MSRRCILFDLDGTLADTAADLAPALNRIRSEEGLPPLPFDQIRPMVSHGAAEMIRRGFTISDQDPRFEPLRQRLLTHYQHNLSHHTRLFPGFDNVLETIEQRGIPWGVVTNKPQRFTTPLAHSLGIDQRATTIISGDTTPFSKPDPTPLLHACGECGADPGQSIYVGDAERDIEAGSRAGMTTLIALFGYIGPDDQCENWGADGAITTPDGLLEWLE